MKTMTQAGSSRTILRSTVLFLAGLGLGIPVGYVVNDLTSIENEEVVEAMRRDEAVQQDLDDFFQDLATEASEEGSGSGADAPE